MGDLTGGLGADVVIEAVGLPATFELCTTLVRPGGHVANIGVHGQPVNPPPRNAMGPRLTITTGLVDAYSTPRLLSMVAAGQLDTTRFITHRFKLHQIDQAYDAFGDPTTSHALKVVLTRD